MLVVGLTGGIGSGKSTVSRLLSERGAVIVDADLAARKVVEPGGPAYQGVLDRFGPGILASDGTIDRPALAAIVFRDPAAPSIAPRWPPSCSPTPGRGPISRPSPTPRSASSSTSSSQRRP